MTEAWVAFRAYFGTAATRVAGWMGSPFSFILAAFAVFVWALMGPRHHYSNTWQLVINTATTIITFLMVFLIQNTQNRDARAIHLKLDELIRSVHSAHNEMIDIEKLSDEELAELAKRYERIRMEYEFRHQARKSKPAGKGRGPSA